MHPDTLKELVELDEMSEARIIISTETKLRLERLCKENQSYNDVISILIDLLEAHEKVGNIISNRKRQY